MSWYDLWCNWLNTTIRIMNNCPRDKGRCNYNQGNVGLYDFKDNSRFLGKKSRYAFGRVKHFEHKTIWKKTHRGRQVLY